MRQALLALVLLACGRPDYGNGSWQCADYADCPEGMACSQSDNRCYAINALPLDAAPPVIDANTNTLTVIVTGPGHVRVDQTVAPTLLGDCTGTCDYEISPGAGISIAPTPTDVMTDYFVGFTATGGTCTMALGACTMTPTADVEVSAPFTTFSTLQIERDPAGAPAVTPSPAAAASCTPTGTFTDCFRYRRDTSVTVDYAPATGSFAGFAGTPRSCAGRNACLLDDMTANHEVTVRHNAGGVISAAQALAASAAASLVEVNDVFMAETGEIFVAGAFTGTLTLGAQPTLTSAGGRDGFVARYDSATGWQWSRALGSDGDEAATVVTVSTGSAGSDNVVVAGSMGTSTTGWDPSGGGSPFVVAGDPDVFLLLYSPDGSFIAPHSVNSGLGSMVLTSIVPRPVSGFWMALTIKGNVRYDTVSLATSDPTNTSAALFVPLSDVLARNGANVWFDTLENDSALAVTTLASGLNVFAGSFCGDGLDVMGSAPFRDSAGASCDGFIVVRSADNSEYRADHVFGSATGNESVVGLVGGARLYAAVEYNAPFDYWPGTTAAARGGRDVLVGAHDYNDSLGVGVRLSFGSLQTFGTSADDQVGGLALQGGTPVLAGTTNRAGTEDLFLSTATTSGLRIAGTKDAFAVGMTTTLAVSWMHILGGAGDETAGDIEANSTSSLVVGSFSGEGGFGLGPVSAIGTSDGFFLKIAP